MPALNLINADEYVSRENRAMELAESWINGNRKNVALICASDVGLMAAVVLCLGVEMHGPDLLRYLSTREYAA